MSHLLVGPASSNWALSVLTSTSWFGAALAVVGIAVAAFEGSVLLRAAARQRTAADGPESEDLTRLRVRLSKRLRVTLTWTAAGVLWAVLMTVLARPELVPYAVAMIGAAASVIAIVTGIFRAHGTRSFNGIKTRTLIIVAAITATVAFGLLFAVPPMTDWLNGLATCSDPAACPAAL